MIRPFRKYQVVKDWIDQDKNTFESSVCTINLFDVTRWNTCNNAREEFNDTIERCIICLEDGAYIFRVSYSEFDKVMTEFLYEARLLDDRSMKSKKKEKEYKPYEGPIRYMFEQGINFMSCIVYPKNFYTEDEKEAIDRCLWAVITPYN